MPEIARVRTQSRAALLPHLERVHEAARRDRRARFTALLHHVTVEALDRAFHRLKRRAAPGVDGETVTSYEQGLAVKLGDLHARVQTGRYRPHPVRRVYIPKANGGRRPLGIPALEDKIVQSAVAEVLSALYAYYGLPSNWHRLDSFYDAVRRYWYRVLRRRSQRSLTWASFTALEARFPLPQPRITPDRAIKYGRPARIATHSVGPYSTGSA